MLASYGGGHAQIIAAVAQELAAQGADIDLIGFTTARAVFERWGLPSKSVTALLEPEDDAVLELALLRAARAAHVPSVAIGDLFLKKEASWITQPGYAGHLFVLSNHVRSLLVAAGLTGTQIHITGNPVFDQLHDRQHCKDLRDNLRRQTNDESNRVILWPAVSAPVSMIGRSFEAIENVVAFLAQYCADRPGTSFLIRPHPNAPLEDLSLPATGRLTPMEWSIED